MDEKDILEQFDWLIEPFEITEDVDRMLGDHPNTDGTYEILETLENGDKIAQLKPEVAKELAETYETFTSYKYASEYEKEANAIMEEKVKNALKELGADVESYDDISSDIYEDRMGNYTLEVEIVKDRQTETFQPHGYYMQDDGHGALEAMKSPGYEWLVWLAHYESPLFDEGFKEAYLYDYYMNTLKTLAEMEENLLLNSENELLEIKQEFEDSTESGMKSEANMNTYIVRPYFGHDCNSVDGFNNGYYLDEMEIEANSPEEASEKALKEYCKENGIDEDKDDNEMGDFIISNIKVYVDPDGNEISEEEFNDAYENDPERAEEYGYLYEYIDFAGDVEEVDGVEDPMDKPLTPFFTESNKSEGKVVGKYNPNGAWDYKPFGFKDLEGPIYHDEGRLINDKEYIYAPKSKGLVGIEGLIDSLREAADNFEYAKARGANHVNFGKNNYLPDDKVLEFLLNGTCLDTNDQYEVYKKFVDEFKKEHGRRPNKKELIEGLK